MKYMPPLWEEPRRRWRRLDRIVRLIIFNWAMGGATGAAMATLMLAFDVLGLRTLLGRTDVAALGATTLVALFALTFAGVFAATAAMRAGQNGDDDPKGGLRAPTFASAKLDRAAG